MSWSHGSAANIRREIFYPAIPAGSYLTAGPAINQKGALYAVRLFNEKYYGTLMVRANR